MKPKMTALTAALLLTAMLAACGEEAAPAVPAAETAAASETPEETAAAETEIAPDIPDTLDLNGDTVSILFREEMRDEFDVDEMNGEVVNDAVFSRNRAVEEQLNCVLKYIPNPSQDWNGGYQAMVKNSVMAGDHAYDIISGPSFHIPTLISDKCLFDLSEIPYLDFDKPWWVQGLLETTTFGGAVYLVSGDISLGLVRYMNCTYFNKTLAAAYDLPDLHQLVLDGGWTLDRLKTLTAGTYQDINGNGAVEEKEDMFGYTIPSKQAFRSYYDAVGVRYVYVDANENAPVVNTADAMTVALYDFMTDWLNSSNDIYWYMENNQTAAYDMFTESRVLFAAGRIVDSEKGFRNMDVDFGVLPVPKWSEEQTVYGSTICGSESTFGVPVDSVKTETIGAVMELLAYRSYLEVTPAYYDVAFRFKYSRGESAKESEVVDMIREGASFTPIINMSKLIGNNLDYWIIEAIQDGKAVSTVMAGHEKATQEKIDMLMETLKAE